MIASLKEYLSRLGSRKEDLNEEELMVYQSWEAIFNADKPKIEDLAKFSQGQRDMAAEKMADPELSEKSHQFYAALYRLSRQLHFFLTATEAQKMALADELERKLKALGK